MNRQERARLIASLTSDELEQLRAHVSESGTSDALSKADSRFARTLFGGGSDDDQDHEQEDHDDGQDDNERANEKRFLATLFANTSDDPIIAGIVTGRTVGRTTP